MRGVCVISLPRSQVEMTDWDQEWQDKISKLVRRVAKDLIATDETEISEVVRRRLFQELGSERIRKSVDRSFGDWCFERGGPVPPFHADRWYEALPALRRHVREHGLAQRWDLDGEATCWDTMLRQESAVLRRAAQAAAQQPAARRDAATVA